MPEFIDGEYKIRVDGTSTGRGPVICVPNYWGDGEDWEFCEFESTEFRGSDSEAKWIKSENGDKLMATAFLFAASPKLLEACRDAISGLDIQWRDFGRIKDNLENAIALATNTSAPVEKMIGGRPESEA